MCGLRETGQQIGFITPLTHNFCESCNRVRLTCTRRALHVPWTGGHGRPADAAAHPSRHRRPADRGHPQSDQFEAQRPRFRLLAPTRRRPGFAPYEPHRGLRRSCRLPLKPNRCPNPCKPAQSSDPEPCTGFRIPDGVAVAFDSLGHLGGVHESRRRAHLPGNTGSLAKFIGQAGKQSYLKLTTQLSGIYAKSPRSIALCEV